jgi:putative transposase
MPTGVIVHTDRGSQYCSNAYQNLLARQGLVCSMSGFGNCYDNAVAQSLFHSLKVELTAGCRFEDRETPSSGVVRVHRDRP